LLKVSEQVLASHLIVSKSAKGKGKGTFQHFSHLYSYPHPIGIGIKKMDPEGELCALFEEIKHHIKVIANAHGVMTYYLS
jgi:hypothetical protein